MIGLRVDNNKLYFNEELIVESSINEFGIYVDNNRHLFFNGAQLTTESIRETGFEVIDNSLYFDGVIVSESENNPEFSPEGFWIPPTQDANVAGKNWTYSEIISMYDDLMLLEPRLTKHRYEDSLGAPILSYGDFELFHYKYEPPSYTKTIFMTAQIHGNEKDSRLTLLRMIEILITERNNVGYTAWQEVYDDCRLIFIPVVSPWGNDNSSMNVPYTGAEHGINMNRNHDFNHQYALPSTGVGGDSPFEMTEVQHTRDVVELYGAENIDYAIDYHDGGNVEQHYWISYAVDGKSRDKIMQFVNYLIDKYDISSPVIPNCKDVGTTGTTQGWFAKTMGVSSSTNEWIGGLLGYTFDSSHLTQSLEIRANQIFMALHNDFKEWKIEENPTDDYFHWDYPRAFTRDTLRAESAPAETKVTDEMIYQRWDSLQAKYPSLITKSAQLGFDVTGTIPIHTYTFGTGATKVLYVGGIMRFGGGHKIDEYAIYSLIEYLCTPYIVNQSSFLTELYQDYTIIVLPFIDNIAQNSIPYREAGLNNTTLSRQRWIIDENDKTIPAPNAHGTGNHAVSIILNLINNNLDLKCIVSGGEIMSGYSGNPEDYTEDYQTQFIIPRNMTSDISDYTTHLTTNRGELVDVDNTQGATFGDYAYDQYTIPTYFVQQKISDRFINLGEYHTLTETQYIHSNYEAGRRIANIVNLFLK